MVRRAELAVLDLPDFGLPTVQPTLSEDIYLNRLARLRERCKGDYTHIFVYGDREHSANIAYLTGFDPRFEEAALVDGYSRWAAFWRIIVPHARTGIAVTAVFCLISALNEYGFAVTLNNFRAKTVPVYFAGLRGTIQGIPWPQVAAGVLLFAIPIVVFTIVVRKHLLRGITFGTVKQ